MKKTLVLMPRSRRLPLPPHVVLLLLTSVATVAFGLIQASHVGE